MNQNRKTTIILIGFILMALIVCGIIGYVNDSGRVSLATEEIDEILATETPAAIDLIYCYNPVDLCIVSFGQDNAGNMLIVIRNNIPDLTEFYAKLNPTDASDLFPCQKVQFATDLYYCFGDQIPDGTMVTMEIYSKNDERLVASGRIPVSLEATPAPTETLVPTETISPLDTQTPLAYPYP